MKRLAERRLSRVPVRLGSKSQSIGYYLMVKDLVMTAPTDAITLSSLRSAASLPRAVGR